MNTVKTIQRVDTTGEFGATAVEIEAAGYYEEKFVPTLFQPWVAPIIAAAGVESGDRVLDIACGTGVVTRAISSVAGATPAAAGLDISAGMLQVASRISPGLDWHLGSAEALPFADRSFDRVLCQFGLMFFADRVQALAEMRRVLKPGGCVAVAVWNSLEHNPGFADKVDILQAVAGQAAADALRAPFCLGDADALAGLARGAGMSEFRLQSLDGQARFDCLADFVDAELRGWLPVMGVHLDEDKISEIYRHCSEKMTAYDFADGGFVLPTAAQVFTASR